MMYLIKKKNGQLVEAEFFEKAVLPADEEEMSDESLAKCDLINGDYYFPEGYYQFDIHGHSCDKIEESDIIEKYGPYRAGSLNDFCKKSYHQNKLKGFWKEREDIVTKISKINDFLEINGKTSLSIQKEEIDFFKSSIKSKMLLLIISELTEALEADRKDRNSDVRSFEENLFGNNDNYKELYEEFIKDSFEAEIAGTFIRLTDMVGGLGIDIEYFINAEMHYNRLRKNKHGKKY